ncbi:MAG: agmatine deiminase family protein [Bacteroidota bacterium]
MQKRRLPAEWEPQQMVQFTFPHQQTDWIANWEQAVACFVEIIHLASTFQPVLLTCQDQTLVQSHLPADLRSKLQIHELPSNDTWARDHGAITVWEGEKRLLLDFVFNGWGQKFPADLDNQLSQQLHRQGVWPNAPMQSINFVLEGGSLESDGKGSLLTTTQCLLSPHRNPQLSKEQIKQQLKEYLGLTRVLWLENGHLAGDDTDAHIDTLARFCSEEVIAYVQCTDATDEHFDPLQAMERELQGFRQLSGQAYRLIPLPLPRPIFAEDGHRLPATYANFLILNQAVLVPVYGVPEDQLALDQLRPLFPNRTVLPVNCRALIEQHGSLHCLSMNYY